MNSGARERRDGAAVAEMDRPTIDRGRGPDAIEPARGSRRRVWVPRWLPEILLLALLYVVYSMSRGLVDSHPSVALGNGEAILAWEQRWHLAPEFALNHLLDQSLFLGLASSYYYATLHFVVTPVVLIWMYRRRSAQYGMARTVLAIGSALALVGYYVIPTAPPRLLPGTGLVDIVSNLSGYGWWARGGSVPHGLISLANPYAAMPSLHVAWALWCGVLLFVYSRHLVVKIAGVLYPLATTFVVLATANHYLLDAVAGAAVMGAALAVVLAVQAVRRRAELAPATA